MTVAGAPADHPHRATAASAPPPGARILVVDDVEANRDLLVRRLERLGHSVVTAGGGAEALALLASTPVDLVLLDVMMPGLSGPDVLARIKDSPTLRHLPVVMISALDETATVVRCIELGAEDYLPKPFDPVLLRARVNACLEKKRFHDREAAHARALEHELDIGRRIQVGFLPTSLPEPPGWQIAAAFRPARQVAGDFYDAFVLPDDDLVMLVVADVCDKGVGAALFMALFRSLFRAVAGQDDDAFGIGHGFTAELPTGPLAGGERRLRRAVQVTNEYIARTHADANMFATMFVAVVDPASGRFRYINGGHEPPAIVADGAIRARLTPTGPAVGMLPGLAFRVGAGTLAPGEALVAFTDGVSESRAPDGSFLSEERMLAAIAARASSAGEIVAAVDDCVVRHGAGAELADDVTLLVIRRD